MKVLFLGSHWTIKFSPEDILGWSREHNIRILEDNRTVRGPIKTKLQHGRAEAPCSKGWLIVYFDPPRDD